MFCLLSWSSRRDLEWRLSTSGHFVFSSSLSSLSSFICSIQSCSKHKHLATEESRTGRSNFNTDSCPKRMYNCTTKQLSNYTGKLLNITDKKTSKINVCNTVSKKNKSWVVSSGRQCIPNVNNSINKKTFAWESVDVHFGLNRLYT